MRYRSYLPTILILVSTAASHAQEAKVSNPPKPDAAAIAEARRAFDERRAQVRSLLLSLASDARSYRDQTLRARTLGRIADALWEADAERAQELFRKAWEAAEIADKEGRMRMKEEARQQKAKTGGYVLSSPPNLRSEVLRMAAKHDRGLGEEFLEKLKDAKQQEAMEEAMGKNPGPLSSSEATRQRLQLAGQLLQSGEVERAIQFADPALGTMTMDGLNFLSSLRDKDVAAADRRYASMLSNAEGNQTSDANTVSLLSSYVFTPHLFITFTPDGGTNTSQMSRLAPPPNMNDELRLAFLRSAAQILMRPLPPPEQDQTSSGRGGKYLVLKRLLPLFDQYTPKETAAAMRAQMDSLAATLTENQRNNSDEWVTKGIGPERKSEDREQSLLNRLDRASNSDERDQIYLQLAIDLAGRGELRAREFADKIEDSDLRKQTRPYVDMTIAMQLISKKEVDQSLEVSRTGDLTHVQRVWVLTQAGMLLAKTDKDRATTMLEQATEEARRIEGSDADRPRALMGVASGFSLVDRSRAWDALADAIKAANSSDGYTGEDSRLTLRLQSKGMNSLRTNTAEDFDVPRIFTALAKDDYDRTVELARGFQAEAPRASAVIAISRAVLSQKFEPPGEKAAKKN